MIAADKFWDKVAAKYAKTPIKDEDAYEQTLTRVRAHLNPSDRVLELGCGTGTTALKLAGDAKEIVASDISPAMIDLGRAKAVDADIRNVTFHTTTFNAKSLRNDGPYDVVTAFNLLHLIEDLPGAMGQIFDLVRPGGLFISKTFCRPGPGEGNLEYHVTRVVLPLMQAFRKAPFVAFMTIDDLEGAVRAAGFEIIETGNYPDRPPRRFIVARKPEA
ncbi:MAG: class I SAM-dependent methyltransferase [Pseudomonadota bacterium]